MDEWEALQREGVPDPEAWDDLEDWCRLAEVLWATGFGSEVAEGVVEVAEPPREEAEAEGTAEEGEPDHPDSGGLIVRLKGNAGEHPCQGDRVV